MEEAVVVTEPRWTVTLPSFDESDEVDSCITYLQDNTDKRGVKKLLSQLQKYQMHANLVASFADRARHTVQYINGVRTRSATGNGLKKTALRFYESLNTPALRMQCTLFNVDYDSFEDQETIINTLVEKHVAMMNGEKVV